MKTFYQFFTESVERRTYRVRCHGVDYNCEPINIEKSTGTLTKSFHHAAKSKFLAKAYYKLNPNTSIHSFIKKHYNNCSVVKL